MNQSQWQYSQDVPVESGPGVESKTAVEAGDGGQVAVIGRDPGHPAEGAESREDVVGEPEPHKHSSESDVEELLSAKVPDTAERTVDGAVLVAVEGGVQGDGHQRRGPDTVRRVHEETTAETGQTVADEVGRQRDEELVAEVGGIRHVEELGEPLESAVS